jgi:predicted dehydrogenase
MTKRLGAAVIGCGGVGRLRHIPAMREGERQGLVELVAICDPSGAALEAAGEEFGVAERHVDYRAVLVRDDVDLVTIATPNSSHEPIATAALSAGKHVMCEKPLALSLAGARRMAAAARASGRRTSVNYRYRWVPSARYMKELFDGGDVGEARQLFMNYFNAGVLDPTRPMRWRNTRAEGGGNLGDIGSHMIDMAIWLLGPVARVSCHLHTFTGERPTDAGGRAPVDVDDAATCLLEMDSGALVVINASGVCLGKANHQRVELYGTKGSVIHEIDRTGDLGGDAVQVCFSEAQHRTAGMATAPVLPRHHATPISSFLEFLRAVSEERDPPVTFEDAVRVQEVLEAAELSAQRGGWVDLPLPDEAQNGPHPRLRPVV